MGMFSKVLPSSTVVSTWTGFPPDMDDWNCAQWKSYYLNNVKALGKEKALDIVNIDSERVGMFATVHSCKYDCEWLNFFRKEGLDANNIFTYLYCGATNVAGSVYNATAIGKNVTGTVASISSSKIGALALLAFAGFIGYKVYKNSQPFNK